MKHLLLLPIMFVLACGGTTTLQPTTPPTFDKTQLEKDYPNKTAYDPTIHGSELPDTIVNPITNSSETVPAKDVEAAKKDGEKKADAKLKEISTRLRQEATMGFFSKEEAIQNATTEYLAWVDEQQKTNSSAGDWLWQRAKEAFDYGGQIAHLQAALPIVFGHVLCDGSDKDAYSEAMAYVVAVTVEIIAGVGCAAGGFSAPVVTLVCMPLGYIAGAALGQFILGPVIYDLRCN